MFTGGRLPVGRTINDSSPNASAAGCLDKHAGHSQADWLIGCLLEDATQHGWGDDKGHISEGVRDTLGK